MQFPAPFQVHKESRSQPDLGQAKRVRVCLIRAEDALVVRTVGKARASSAPITAAGPALSSAPLVVLVNEHTASASEILAGGLAGVASEGASAGLRRSGCLCHPLLAQTRCAALLAQPLRKGAAAPSSSLSRGRRLPAQVPCRAFSLCRPGRRADLSGAPALNPYQLAGTQGCYQGQATRSPP
jgi:hypothetical protein